MRARAGPNSAGAAIDLVESRSAYLRAPLARFAAGADGHGLTSSRVDKFVAHSPVFSRCTPSRSRLPVQMGSPRFAALLLLLPHAGTPLSLKNT